MTPQERKVMQMALEVLEHGLPIIEDYGGKRNIQLQHKAIAVLYEALRAALANEFNPDWDAMAVMVEEQQRMAKRIEELKERLLQVELNPPTAQLAQPEQDPVWGDSQVTKPEIVAEQKAMNEGLRKMVEQEPVAWMHPTSRDCVSTQPHSYKDAIPLYTTPPQREWQGLTDEEIERLFVWQEWSEDFADYEPVARAIEAKLREKNT